MKLLIKKFVLDSTPLPSELTKNVKSASEDAPEVVKTVEVTTLQPKTTTEDYSDYAEPDVDDGSIEIKKNNSLLLSSALTFQESANLA